MVNGRMKKSGELENAAVAPLTEAEVSVPLKTEDLPQGQECFINFKFKLAEDTAWAPKGFVVASEQIAYPSALKTNQLAAAKQVEVKKSGGSITVHGSGFKVTFADGLLQKYSIGERRMLLAPLQPNFWRAPNDNENAWRKALKNRINFWRTAIENAKISDMTVEKLADGLVKISSEIEYPAAKAKLSIAYLVNGAGAIEVSFEFSFGKGVPLPARIGMKTAVAKSCRRIEWYGRGPFENYWDRRRGADVGRYSSDIDNLNFVYEKPQECGNRTDVRWLKVDCDKNGTLQVKGNPLINFSLSPYAASEVAARKHAYELVPADYTILNIDYGQLGVGGNTTWGGKAIPLEKYQFKPKKIYKYSFVISGAAKNR
jgi:beta-galactosidase